MTAWHNCYFPFLFNQLTLLELLLVLLVSTSNKPLEILAATLFASQMPLDFVSPNSSKALKIQSTDFEDIIKWPPLTKKVIGNTKTLLCSLTLQAKQMDIQWNFSSMYFQKNQTNIHYKHNLTFTWRSRCRWYANATNQMLQQVYVHLLKYTAEH